MLPSILIRMGAFLAFLAETILTSEGYTFQMRFLRKKYYQKLDRFLKQYSEWISYLRNTFTKDLSGSMRVLNTRIFMKFVIL